MFNTLSPAWVKNVYSLRKIGGTTGEYSFTVTSSSSSTLAQIMENFLFIRTFITALSPALSTRKNSFLSLLYSRLYPLSTVPITTKTKEN